MDGLFLSFKPTQEFRQKPFFLHPFTLKAEKPILRNEELLLLTFSFQLITS